MAASKAALEQLHMALCKAFDDVLTNGVKEIDKETGELVAVTAPAAYLNVIRQFIKDNDIKAAPVKGTALEAFANDKPLPFAGSDHPANRTDH
jgi:hypothetical protein